MRNAVIGIYDCIHKLENAISDLNNKGYHSGDITLITSDENDKAGYLDIPVIQVTDVSLIWEMILEYVGDEGPAFLSSLKESLLNAGKYVLLIEKIEAGVEQVPAYA